MAAQPSIYSLDSAKIGRLLNLYQQSDEDDSGTDSDNAKASLLRDCLSDVPALSSDVVGQLPVMLRHMVKQLPRIEGRSLGQFLTDPDSGLEDFKRAKDEAKKVISAAQTDVAYEVAGVQYYAAIAGAVLYHNERITRHSHEQLRTSFRSLQDRRWIPAELRELFTRAAQVFHESGANEKRLP